MKVSEHPRCAEILRTLYAHQWTAPEVFKPYRIKTISLKDPAEQIYIQWDTRKGITRDRDDLIITFTDYCMLKLGA